MIDKNNIIITKNERIKTLLTFIKNNAVLVPIITFCVAVFTVGVNSFVYTYTISYFNYFGIDAKYMLPVNNMGLYQGLVQGILVVLFWCYAILAFQALLIKGHLKNKFIMIIVVPIIISIVFFYEEGLFQYGFSWTLVLACILFVIFQWIGMAILGGMIVLPFYMPKMESQKPFKTDILTNGLRGVYGLFLILTLYAAIYFMGHQLAKEHNRFGIVQIKGSTYAVLDLNQTNLLMLKCNVNANRIVINKNSYLRMRCENVNIEFRNFKSVRLKSNN